MQRWLTRLIFSLAAVAAILWLLPLFASHSVLFPSGPNFEDIVVYQGRFTVYHTLRFFTSRAFSGFAYPPGAAPIYEAFYATSDAIQAYLVLAGATTLAALAAAYLCLRRNGAAKLFLPLLLFCFPLIFLIQRANIEIVLWIIVVLGVLAYRRGMAILAAILIGIAASIKLYPILLLGLFLKPASRRTRQDLPAFAVVLVTAIVALIAATAYTGPTFLLAAHGFTTGVDRFQDHYVDTVSRVEVAFDHSLFSPIKYWAYSNHASPAPWTLTYYFIAGAFALLLFVHVRTLPFLNRIVFLLAAMVSLPPVSFTYTLVHLYLPLLLLLCALATSRTTLPATAVAVCALLLFVMLPLVSLYVFQPLPTGPIVSFTLLAVLILSALTAWPDAPGSKAL